LIADAARPMTSAMIEPDQIKEQIETIEEQSRNGKLGVLAMRLRGKAPNFMEDQQCFRAVESER
jgi:hypothetical protein